MIASLPARLARRQAAATSVGRPEPRVEDDVDVRASEDGVDVGRDRRAEADVEPARLAEVQAVLGGVVDDPAAELEPRSGEPGLDDHPAGMPRRPDRGPDPAHPSPPLSTVGVWRDMRSRFGRRMLPS